MRGEVLVYNTSITNLVLLLLPRLIGSVGLHIIYTILYRSGWKNPIIFMEFAM